MLQFRISQENATLEGIQNNGIRFLSLFTLLQAPLIALAAWGADNAMVAFLVPSLVLGVLCMIVARGSNKLLAINIISVALMGQVALIVAALKGHPYQIDVHMYFFAVLGMLAGMLSVWAILFATVTVAVHHLALYLLLPAYVFPGESDFLRVALHAVILLCEAGVLLWIIALVTSAFNNATKKKDEAEEALEKAEAAERERVQAQEAAVAERKALMEKVASDFKQTISSTIVEVKRMLDESMGKFNQIAGLTEAAQQQSASATSAVLETTENTASVAAATEQLNAAIAEIASQAQKSAQSTTTASEDAHSSIEVVGRLSDAAESITEIISVINRIAGQINLLALNATIESARAGEAGRGFAVVAGEVKTLAQQTEQATQQIAESIAKMSSVSGEVSQKINNTVQVVEEIKLISANIATAVEEQSFATNEISRLIQSVSQSSKQVNSNISQLHQGVDQTSSQAKALEVLFAQLEEKADALGSEADGFVQVLQQH